MSDKVKENRLRQMAGRQGLKLVKSRRRDVRAVDFGGFMLVDVLTNGVVLGSGAFPYQADVDDVEAYLTGSPEGSGERRARA
ncbi:hypothetical protein [Ancylobacter sp. TS-1]|uniref:hypothetical protein n=1 Tax=Ancylobacter sp. TS-1 TaxID=1850374 RepID=UPI001265C4DD|nr:hypothetical protein [Ancylobacter sp. TS-1]QFR34711.1 hypothetical protein GBB76_17265 [Ancylobacter sp. TS-1]